VLPVAKRPRRRRRGQIRLLVLVPLSLAFSRVGCGKQQASVTPPAQLAPGVSVRQVKAGVATVRVIDVDLGAPGVRVDVAADDIAIRNGRITGRARPVSEWLEETGAVAGINGGFFGASVGEEFKEIVGLLKLDGRVRVAAPRYHSTKANIDYSRAAFGVTREGRPYIDWVTSRPGSPQLLRSHAKPEPTGPGTTWEVEDAVACGPRLIREGKVEITFKGERLASPGALPRTFIGHAQPPGQSRRLLLCAADGMEFEECARFLMEYFQHEYRVPCAEGMCLDGGGSTQAAWREKTATGTRIATELHPGVSVPTALIVYSNTDAAPR
jgi:hypothetical protein